MNDSIFIIGTRRTIRELADGSLRVQIEVDAQYKEMFFRYMPDVDVAVALVPLSADKVPPSGGQPGKEEETLSVIGQLYKYGWFNNQHNLQALGTDHAYLTWLRTKKCVHCGQSPPSQAAHVRRIAEGAGTGIKPTHCAVPLCAECHLEQHQQGESAIGGKDKTDQRLARFRSEWGHIQLRDIFDVDSTKEITITEFVKWAEEEGIGKYIPLQILENSHNVR